VLLRSRNGTGAIGSRSGPVFFPVRRRFDFLLLSATWLVLIATFVGPYKSIWAALVGLGISLLTGLFGQGRFGVARQSVKQLHKTLAGFGAGLGFFLLFVRLGILAWPLTYAGSLADYVFLLFCHVTLVLSILIGFFLLTYRPGIRHCVRWGHWGKGRVFLGVSALASLTAAVQYGFSHQTGFPASLPLVLAIALPKAALTGVGEETFYRGLLQPAAVAHFGGACGLTFQAGLYMLFHVFLHQSFFPQIIFYVFIFGLGLVFGVVTRMTNGIGWAATVHTALDVVIEWSNIS